MTKKTHIATGLATSTAIMTYYHNTITYFHNIHWEELLIGSVIAMIASTLPDADIYDNRPFDAIEDIMKMCAFCFLLQYLDGLSFSITNIYSLLLFAVMLIIVIPMPHRGFSHSLMCGAIFTFIVYRICYTEIYTTWFAIAYASHLIIDILNKKGIPLFYPLTKKKVCFKLCDSNGICNNFLCVIFSVIYIALIYYNMR